MDPPADSVACVETDALGGGEPTDAEVDDSGFAEAGNGEIARADEFQVTKAERESDKNLAVQLVVAFGIGVATMYGAVRPSRNNGTVSGATWNFCRSQA